MLFSETFADNSQGWTLGTTWEIGPAKASSGQTVGYPDPASDHTTGSDNGVAGVVIGGNAPNGTHAAYYLVSPVVDTTSASSGLELHFQRWLNTDFSPDNASVEVYNGSKWVMVWPVVTPNPPTTDSAWTAQQIDISPYSNSKLQIRFGYAQTFPTGAIFSGWNVDDVMLVSKGCQ